MSVLHHWLFKHISYNKCIKLFVFVLNDKIASLTFCCRLGCSAFIQSLILLQSLLTTYGAHVLIVLCLSCVIWSSSCVILALYFYSFLCVLMICMFCSIFCFFLFSLFIWASLPELKQVAQLWQRDSTTNALLRSTKLLQEVRTTDNSRPLRPHIKLWK